MKAERAVVVSDFVGVDVDAGRCGMSYAGWCGREAGDEAGAKNGLGEDQGDGVIHWVLQSFGVSRPNGLDADQATRPATRL